MESRTAPPHPQTLLQNPTIRKKAMEKFQNIIFKLAETHPNAPPLTPPRRALIQDRLNQFVSQYKTPDHPPYSAMIERAIRELNEKGGSSEDSISQFLEKAYNNLPWAHSMLLKHHLGKLCEFGDIVLTRNKRYMLAGETPSTNLSTKVKRKPLRRKWRWDWERDRNRNRNRRRKKQFRKTEQRKSEKKVEVTEKNEKSDVEEQEITENGVHSEDKQVKEDREKRLLSHVEDDVHGDPRVELSEGERSQKQEVGPADAMKADDMRDPQKQEQQEREVSKYNQHEVSSPERPPGFEFIRFENLPRFGLKEVELTSGEGFSVSTRMRRQRRRWSRNFPETKAVNLTSVDLETSAKREEETIIIDVPMKLEQPIDSHQLEFPLLEQKPQELHQQPLSQQEESFQRTQPRRSLRSRHPKPGSKYANLMDLLGPECDDCPEARPKRVCRHPHRPSKQKPIIVACAYESGDRFELESPPKFRRRRRRLLKPKPDTAYVNNLAVVDSQSRQDCASLCEKMEELRTEEVLLVSDSNQEPLEEQQRKRKLGRPPKRRSARLMK